MFSYRPSEGCFFLSAKVKGIEQKRKTKNVILWKHMLIITRVVSDSDLCHNIVALKPNIYRWGWRRQSWSA